MARLASDFGASGSARRLLAAKRRSVRPRLDNRVELEMKRPRRNTLLAIALAWLSFGGFADSAIDPAAA
jgi:hypothetical protein